MKMVTCAALVVFAVLAMTASFSFSQTGNASTAQYAVELYRGGSPPPDELIIARIVWELKEKKGTIQEAMHDDLRKRLHIYIRGTYRVNETRFYVFIGGEKDMYRADLFKLENGIWVIEKPGWLLSFFEDTISGIESTTNGFMTIFSN